MFVAAVCAVAGVWFLWRGKRQMGGRASKGMLSVAETRSLGSRQYLVVAAYGEKKYLIGVCVGRISMLAPLDDAANPPSA
jgi:flagellar protein FliO/FliZ